MLWCLFLWGFLLVGLLVLIVDVCLCGCRIMGGGLFGIIFLLMFICLMVWLLMLVLMCFVVVSWVWWWCCVIFCIVCCRLLLLKWLKGWRCLNVLVVVGILLSVWLDWLRWSLCIIFVFSCFGCVGCLNCWLVCFILCRFVGVLICLSVGLKLKYCCVDWCKLVVLLVIC